ncbi:MAG TPA: molybdopterin-dependent oxidoreductase, partial [Thermoanaerobaculia bacterium]|nr:molybdopterin-dependent oxidoreductase [Thermoanaerobaculia bacterium]
GVPLATLLAASRPLPEARFVSFVARSERGHSTSLPLADALALGTLVALTSDGEPLAEIHGGPVRTVVPGRYFYKSLKWLERIELLADDRLGYWEAEMGYHNVADPWKEQRYIAANVDRGEARRLLEARDLSGRDLLSLDAERRDLARLDARGAVLRNASFREAVLTDARFSRANLSNAHLEGADLRRADLRDADVEGADFRGADLRGADFRGASLFGATFRPEPGAASRWREATVDATTRFERGQLDGLSEAQQDFLRRLLDGEGPTAP